MHADTEIHSTNHRQASSTTTKSMSPRRQVEDYNIIARFTEHLSFYMYEGRSINKLQNGAIQLILKIGKIQNISFVGNLILKIHRNFSDDDVIIVTSSVHRTQSICVLFSPPVFYHNSQVINSIGTRKNE